VFWLNALFINVTLSYLSKYKAKFFFILGYLESKRSLTFVVTVFTSSTAALVILLGLVMWLFHSVLLLSFHIQEACIQFTLICDNGVAAFGGMSVWWSKL
jgi:hypothetical protein